MASPRLSKYRTGESGGGDSGDSKGSDYSRKSGAGLSDYTSKRLEELRLRRAESAADSYQEYRAKREAREKEATSTTTNTSSTSGTDYLDLGRRSGGDSTSATTASSVTTTSTSLTSSPYNTSFGQDAIKTSKEGDTCIGFATLPDQIHRKAVKRGFDFTLMVVGESGLGKSTLISSMFLKDLYKDRQLYQVEERVAKTVEIDKNYLEIEEKGVKLRLTIVDTPGFNDSVNAMDCWRPIEEYINQQFDQYFKDESGLNRKNIKDNRVHVCLYFISPFGHGLRQIDVMFMKRLHEKVNIVPVIAKADTLTPKEIRRLKAKVLEQVEQYRIKVYEFPDCDSDEDEDFKQQDKELKQSTPFAVIGSNTIVEVNGRKVRGRLYPWGIVEVENPQHSDFGKLRQMLISTHMQDLKDVTRDIHYENYRAMYIKEQMTKNQRERGSEDDNLVEKNLQKSKLKRDSSPNFEAMMETDALLHQKDEEIRRMHMMLAKMQEQLHSKGQGVNGLGNL